MNSFWCFGVAEKYHSQMKEAQQVVAEKTGTLEAESYKTKRLHVSHFDSLFPLQCNENPLKKNPLKGNVQVVK